jgi:hypothetical protein
MLYLKKIEAVKDTKRMILEKPPTYERMSMIVVVFLLKKYSSESIQK